jgi:ubiquitin-protein ligase/putative AlgH/UPF0301 family transcriptional regulator
MNSVKRINKEYRNILKDPLENIIIKINEDNIYEINFLIIGNTLPYTDGYYWGILKLPNEYPLQPPSIHLKTPNGRFHIDKDICFNNTNFHIEDWNPSWTIKTILLGFYSFMLEDNNNDTLGAIKTTYEEKIEYAKNSLEYNKTFNNFEKIFDLKNHKNIKNIDIDLNEEKLCRFCLESNEPLISICKCKGTNKYIHEDCIRKWSLYSIINQSTHPSYQKNTDKICSICNTEYKIKTKSRDEIMTEITGEDIIQQIKIGNIMISSKNKSENYLKLLQENENNKELYDNLKHWIFSVIIIIEVNDTGIIGINTNRPIENIFNLYEYYKKYIMHHNMEDIVEKQNFFIGGPCVLEKIYALLIINRNETDKIIKDIKIFKENEDILLLGGDFTQIYKLYMKLEVKKQIKIFFGFAGWSKIQLYAEFNKLSWGIANLEIKDLFKRNNYNLINQNNILFVNENIYSRN